jgi:transposase-like protein
MTQSKPTPTYTAEFRTRGVRLFIENRAEYASEFKPVRASGLNDPGDHSKAQNAAYKAIAPKLGCSPDSLRVWCRQAERDAGVRAGLSSEEKLRLKALERENRELRQANEILKKASAYFAAAELDRPFKR